MVCVVYSTDGGTNYTALRCSSAGWAQVTDSVALSAAQDLSRIKVGECTFSAEGGGSLADIGTAKATLYDIWTDGVYSVTASGSGNTARARRPGLVL